jgi:chromate transporter
MASSEVKQDLSGTPVPGLLDLFLAFSGMAVMGFGGVLPWARRMLVEQRGWLSPGEFNEALSLGQFLPGANIINVSVVVGQRFRGPLGSIASVAGLLAGPIAVVIALGSLYLRYGQVPWVHSGLTGVTAAAAGLILSTAMKMAQPLLNRAALVGCVMAALTFIGIGLVRLPLLYVLLVLAPVSVAYYWRRGA